MTQLNWKLKFVSCEEISYFLLNTFWQKDRLSTLPEEFIPNIQGLVRPGLLFSECLCSTYLELAASVGIVALEIVNVEDVRRRFILWMRDILELEWVEGV